MPREIPLSKDKIAIVDDDAYDWLSRWKWTYHNPYAFRSYKHHGRRIYVYMHRLILGCPSGYQVDHINGNDLDNRLDNLRLVTPGENRHNNRRNYGGTSKYTGVSLRKGRIEKWAAYINYEGKLEHIGFYNDEDEAARARDAKAIEIFGIGARLNFPLTQEA